MTAPFSQAAYAVNLGSPPYGAPTFASAYVGMWFDSSYTAQIAGGEPRPVSTEYPMPVTIINGSAGISVSDSQSAAFQGAIAMTPGMTYPAQRSIGFVCTAAGSVTLTLADGSTMTFGIVASPALQTLPLAVTQVTLGSGAAGTFWNLK